MSYYQEDDKGRKVKVYKYEIGEKVTTIEIGDGVLIDWQVNCEFGNVVMNDNGRVREVQAKHIQFLEKA